MQIRLAQDQDAPGMARVIVDTFMQTNQGVMPEAAMRLRAENWTYDVSARSWRETLRSIAQGVEPLPCIYVATGDSGEVVGLAMGEPAQAQAGSAPSSAMGETVGELDILYVRADHQGRGIGRALVQAIAADLHQKGMTSLQVATLVGTQQSRRFYESLGGRLLGTRQDEEAGEIVELVVYGWGDIRTLLAPSG